MALSQLLSLIRSQLFPGGSHMPDTAHTHPPAPTPAAPTDRTRGLSSAGAMQRLAQFGPNAIADEAVPAWRQVAA